MKVGVGLFLVDEVGEIRQVLKEVRESLRKKGGNLKDNRFI